MIIQGGWGISRKNYMMKTIFEMCRKWFFCLTYAIIALQLSTKCDSKKRERVVIQKEGSVRRSVV